MQQTANDMIKCCKSSYQLKQVHAHILKIKHTQNTYYKITQLLLACASCTPPPNISYSFSLFKQLQTSPNTFIWNTMIRVLNYCNYPSQALSLYAKMRSRDIPQDSFTLTFTLKACSHLRSVVHGEQMHTQVVKMAFEAQAHVHSALMNLYVKCSRLETARKLFDEMPVKSTVAWCIMIAAYAEVGRLDCCRRLFDEMPQRDLASWNTMIDAYVQCGRPHEALRLFHEMVVLGWSPNQITMLVIISACGEVGDLEFGQWIRSHYIDNETFNCNNLSVRTALTEMYSKCGRMDLAMNIFNGMEAKDALSWTAVICGMAINGQGEMALELFNEMEKARIRPDEVAFLAVLCACSHAGLLKEGRQYFESMTKDYGLVPKIEHYGCIIDIMGRAGHIEEARQFIEAMPMRPNVVIWRSFLGSCRVHSAMQTAEWAVKQLQAVGQLASDGSYVMLSNVYAEDGRWSEVERVRGLMKEMGIRKKWGCSSLHV